MRESFPPNDVPAGGGREASPAARYPGPAGDGAPRHLRPSSGRLRRSTGPVGATDSLPADRTRAGGDGPEAERPPGADGEDDSGDGDGRRGLFGRRRRPKPPRSLRRTLLEWAGVVAGGMLIALVIEAFLVQAFWIPTPSMATTLNVDDRVLVNKLSYRLHDVHRGDVIVFSRPPNASSTGDDDIKDLIKRVIAVGGDTIEGRDGLVYVNGERVDESGYLAPGTPTDDLPRQTIPDDHVFVMGDNRTNSEDSRVFGPVPEDDIVGRAFLRVLPIGDIGFL